ncbi:hypothetical protein HMPREF9996_02210 [Aggregatibacter actinomycetemcomitans Y4]|nr:hypothetical protein HMPREF9996_02210 [Aggregatibacter actinomycetemcomitans Y4]
MYQKMRGYNRKFCINKVKKSVRSLYIQGFLKVSGTRLPHHFPCFSQNRV